MPHFAVFRERGPTWEALRTMSEQAGWQEHAAFMNALVNDGFIVLGGPLGDGHALLLLVNAHYMEAVGEQFASDPWTAVGLLRITKIEPWDLLLGTS